MPKKTHGFTPYCDKVGQATKALAIENAENPDDPSAAEPTNRDPVLLERIGGDHLTPLAERPTFTPWDSLHGNGSSSRAWPRR